VFGAIIFKIARERINGGGWTVSRKSLLFIWPIYIFRDVREKTETAWRASGKSFRITGVWSVVSDWRAHRSYRFSRWFAIARNKLLIIFCFCLLFARNWYGEMKCNGTEGTPRGISNVICTRENGSKKTERTNVIRE